MFSNHHTQLIRHWEYIHNKRDLHLAHWFEEGFGNNGFESEMGYVDSREERPRILGQVLLKTSTKMVDPKKTKGAAGRGAWGDRRKAHTHGVHRQWGRGKTCVESSGASALP